LFAEEGKNNNSWTIVQIIRISQYQKERLEKGEINAGMLSNFVKSIKLYCEMYDISIQKHCFIGIELLKNDKFY
jgi:hypothetical protein